MSRIIVFLTILFSGIGAYAKCSAVPQTAKDEYASGMFEAFLTQAQGKSTIAFWQFDTAREKAKKAGENILNLIAIERLFAWYRMYGNSMKLFYKTPTGNDRIHGEYRSSLKALSSLATYESEWGNTPEQARIIREFMCGVGEVISGVFCASVSGGGIGFFAGVLAFDGISRIYSSLNSLWTLHQTELAALQEWERNSLKPTAR